MTGEPAGPGGVASGGWRIGRYRVEAVLGTGAFATVYRAVDERLEDTVAVKVLAENHSLDPEIRKRFLTEGRVLRRIDSPHVIDVHDLGETDRQQPFLVLEHASRGTLAQRAHDLRAGGWRPTVADVWAVAEPLARALDAVHRAGVVHRDVNPGNVLLTTRGVTDRPRPGPTAVVRGDERLVLADLGLCKDLALHSGHTSAGGTEGFRPPELRGGPALIDGRADLWSLSALVVWLITGSPPDTAPAPVSAAVAAAGLPADLAQALDRSLAPDPEARHPTPPAWLTDIQAALAHAGAGATTPATETSWPALGGSTPTAAGPGTPSSAGPPTEGAGPSSPENPPAGSSQPAPARDDSPATETANPPAESGWVTPAGHGAGPVGSGGPSHAPAWGGPVGPGVGPPGSGYPPVGAGWDTPAGQVAPAGSAWGGPAGQGAAAGVAWGAAAGYSAADPGWGWRLRQSVWLLATLPVGLTTWAGFLYIGLRARRPAWWGSAVAYGVGAVVMGVLAVVGPVDAQGKADYGAWENVVGTILMVVLWCGGIIHGLLANFDWLRWRRQHPYRMP